MTPAQVDELSFRDLWVLLDASATERESVQREEWRRTFVQVQATMNMMSNKPKPLTHLADKILGTGIRPSRMTIEEYRERVEEIEAVVKERDKRRGESS